jgi:hypothetical protein
MTDLQLARALKRLRRTVLMLQTELRHGRVDDELLGEIDAQVEQGIGMEPRSARLREHVDVLRESLLTPRPELHGDAIRACEKLNDAIEAVVSRLG